MERLDTLIVVKTHPIPSTKYDELVCTAGVTKSGEFVRLYPINFRDLPWTQQYKKYQWIRVSAQKHRQDSRKESYRPNCDTLQVLGEPIPTKNGDWSERAHFVLPNEAPSLEYLSDRQRDDKTSLGVFRPRVVQDLIVTEDDPHWKRSFQEALRQRRLWERQNASKQLPRKVPFKFRYRFECDDARCRGHRMMIADWELGALYWRLVDNGATSDEAANGVRDKFLNEICGSDKNTYFIVGTILAHPTKWVVVGLFYPKKQETQSRLFGWHPA